MTVFLIALLVLSGLLTVIFTVSTAVRAWKTLPWVSNLFYVVLLWVVDALLLDGLNLVPGLL